MNLRSVPRAALGGYLKVLRWPLDQAARTVGGRSDGRAGTAEVELDRAEATVRDVAGTVTGDEQLRQDAARRRSAADARARAATMADAARVRAEQADEELEERRERAQATRKTSTRTAQQRRQQAAQREKAETATAARAEQRRKAASERAEAAQQQAIDDQARRERLETLETETRALDEREEALVAKDEAERLTGGQPRQGQPQAVLRGREGAPSGAPPSAP